ncbi:protein kinase [Streptomyces pratensis]|uniref:protein kinase n=1 Tax=Streptomyces pratensis TaxID=1169025 RepID=UPI003017492F
MDDYAGRVLADRYRLPLPPSDGYELVETRAFDTYSGQEVLLRQVPLPEIVDAEVLDLDGRSQASGRGATGRAVRRSTDPAVRRAIEAAQAAAQVPDHPRLDQVFDVFAEAGSLWIVSELVAARPLAALLAERPLNPYRAAEIGSDVLTALRVLHAHGWTHRNITVRTVLVCDDGRVVLTGLAAGAAEEALCGYATAPHPDADPADAVTTQGVPVVEPAPSRDVHGAYPLPPAQVSVPPLPQGYTPRRDDRDEPSPEPVHGARPGRRADQEDAAPTLGPAPQDAYDAGPQEAYEAHDPYEAPGAPASDGPRDEGPHGPYTPRPEGPYPSPAGQDLVPRPAAPAVPYAAASPAGEGATSAAELRAARAGAIAAYRAGARAAARGDDRERSDHAPADLTKPPPAGPAQPPAPGAHGDGARRSTADADTGVLPLPRPAAPGPDADAPAAPRLAGPWTSPAASPYDGEDDEDDEDEEEGPRPPGRRVHLAGIWDDGPGSGRSVSAGGSGAESLRADARRPGPPARAAVTQPAPAPRLPAGRGSSGTWEDAVADGRESDVYRGPTTPLASERARQARIAVVGAVTERWAPEQAGPVHENWRLAPPIGPSTDLWALGALLYRAVQGHAPYPEESAAELVQMVCGEPPAFAEECGPLRPVVESLLRQDPTERPDVEELSGWLRSLVRSAPEPEAGVDVVPLPADAARLPVVRRRGELVRRRWGRFGQGAAPGRHRQGKRRQPPRGGGAGRPERGDALLPPERSAHLPVEAWEDERPARAPHTPKGPRVLREPPRRGEGAAPRRLGRLLLLLVLALMAAAIAYAVMFMPQREPAGDGGAQGAPAGSAAPATPQPSAPDEGSVPDAGSTAPGSQQPQTSRSAVALAPGYTMREDPEGFVVGVPKDWQRSPANADRQIRYGSDGFTLLVVPGRDTVKASGDDPLAYQRDKEPELQPFRDSSWSSSSGLRRVDVGRQAMAEGQFTWQESGGREVFVRNLAMIVDGRYHVIQVIGPESDRDRVTEIYEQAIASYRPGA